MSTREARARVEYEMNTSVREARGEHEISAREHEISTSVRGARAEREGSTSTGTQEEHDREGRMSVRGSRGEHERSTNVRGA